MAWRLATYLAGAPLSLPLMRVVQHVMLRNRVRATSRRSSSAACCAALPDRDLGKSSSNSILESEKSSGPGYEGRKLCGSSGQSPEHISEQLGSPLAFSTFFALGPNASDRQLDRDASRQLTEPFASVAIALLRSVGGHYREMADKLAPDPC